MKSIRNGNVWSIILAGGKGERLRPAVQTWFGYDKPKQYCTFVGSRSMFQHTLDRADQISTPERKVTVVSRAHSQVALSQIERRKSGKIIVQPANRDTAARRESSGLSFRSFRPSRIPFHRGRTLRHQGGRGLERTPSAPWGPSRGAQRRLRLDRTGAVPPVRG